MIASAFTAGLLMSASLQCTVSHTQLALEEQLHVDLQTEVPPGSTWDVASLRAGLDLLEAGEGTFTIVEQSVVVDPRGDARAHFILEPWREGTAYLHFLPARLIGPDGEEVRLYSDVYAIGIAPPVTAAGIAPAPVLPLGEHPAIVLNPANAQALQTPLPRHVHPSWRLGLYRQMVIVGALFLLVGVAIWAWHRLKGSGQTLQQVDPYKRALDALCALKAQELPEKGLFEQFYVEITAIVREFVESRYEIRAPEQTTEEFLRAAASCEAFSPHVKGLLREFLAIADLVKFARHHPSLDQCHEAFGVAGALISPSASADFPQEVACGEAPS